MIPTKLRKLCFLIALSAGVAACGNTRKKAPEPLTEPPPNQLPSGQAIPAVLDEGADATALAPVDTVLIPDIRVIHFDYDKAAIRDEERAILEAHAKYLIAHPEITVRLDGHADERGSREYNLALGERRALAAERYLNIMGVGPTQSTSFSYGEEKPVDPGHNEAAWQLNRRVEIIYPGGGQ